MSLFGQSGPNGNLVSADIDLFTNFLGHGLMIVRLRHVSNVLGAFLSLLELCDLTPRVELVLFSLIKVVYSKMQEESIKFKLVHDVKNPFLDTLVVSEFAAQLLFHLPNLFVAPCSLCFNCIVLN